MKFKIGQKVEYDIGYGGGVSTISSTHMNQGVRYYNIYVTGGGTGLSWVITRPEYELKAFNKWEDICI